MAHEWLGQYSRSDLAQSTLDSQEAPQTRNPNYHRNDSRGGLSEAYREAERFSLHGSEQSYPESVEPGDKDSEAEQVSALVVDDTPSAPINVPLRSGANGLASRFGTARSESVEDDTEAVELFLKNRRPSITFDPKVRLGNGDETTLKKGPSPNLSLRTTRLRGRSLLDDISKERNHPRPRSETDSQEYDPVTGERLDERPSSSRGTNWTANESRWPFLQSTVNALASVDEPTNSNEDAPSMSRNTGSIQEEAPPHSSMHNNAQASPISISSPARVDWSVAHSEGVPRRLSSRSKSYALERNSFTNRRVSRRSTASSASPASLFLARYSPASPLPMPDDEGQEIGDYVLGKEIGYGGFSLIREAFTLSGDTRISRAVKIVRRSVSGKNEHENEALQAEFEHEVEIWRRLSHKYILPLIAVYNTGFATFAITQLNTGGTFFDVVRNNRSGIEPRLARRYTFQLAAAIRYLHEDMHIVHRDLKLENCLVDRSGPDSDETGGKLLLCDFGLADYITSDSNIVSAPQTSHHHSQFQGAGHDPRTPSTVPSYALGPSDTSTSIAGSLPYAAPELLESDQGILSTTADMWAYGVVCFALIVGKLPFNDSFAPRLRMMILGDNWDKEQLRAKEGLQRPEVQNGKANGNGENGQQAHGPYSTFEENLFQGISELIERCLEIDPLTRWDIQDVLCSRWLQEEAEREGTVDEL